MLLGVRATRFLGMGPGVTGMSAGGMSMVRGLFMMTAFVMFGGFAVMSRRIGMVLRRLFVMLRCFLGHDFLPFS